jgi:diketogulonate reductase-like aldo/keto reductase
MDLNSTLTLNNGVQIPVLGLGTFRSKLGEETYNAVRYALEAGYRHIDTAAVYGNEESVGEAIRDSKIPREQIFVTTKLWNEDMRRDNQQRAIETSLKKLGLSYVDLYLIHWPVKGKYVESWLELEKIYKKGLARAIGVSNFHIHHLEDVFKVCQIVPAVNQVECHPYLTQTKLADYCSEKGILFEPWSPLAAGKAIGDKTLAEIGAKYGKNTAQVILRWGLQRGFINIPKSTHRDRIVSNADIFGFSLSKEDMDRIFALNKNERVGADPETFTF